MLRINPNYDPDVYDRCYEFASYINEEKNKLSKRIIQASQVLQQRIDKPIGN